LSFIHGVVVWLLGGGAQACRHMLERSKLRSDWFIVEGAHKSKGCERVSQSAKGKVKGAFIFKLGQGRKGALLGAHSSRNLIAMLERS
jgi:hypothetical protein